MKKEITFEYYDDTDAYVLYSLPAKMEVCERCQGEGKHDHPAFSNGISSEEFDEDPDFRGDYFSGKYDVACENCNGLRVELVVDEERADPKTLEIYYKSLREKEANRREWQREIERGC